MPAFQARGVCGHWPPGHPDKLKFESRIDTHSPKNYNIPIMYQEKNHATD